MSEEKNKYEAEVYKNAAKWMMIKESVMWLFTALAVAFSAYFTKSAWCLWAFLIPAFGGHSLSFGGKEKK